MATKLRVSVTTIKNRLNRIFKKVGVSDRLALALYGVNHGLHEIPLGEEPMAGMEPMAGVEPFAAAEPFAGEDSVAGADSIAGAKSLEGADSR